MKARYTSEIGIFVFQPDAGHKEAELGLFTTLAGPVPWGCLPLAVHQLYTHDGAFPQKDWFFGMEDSVNIAQGFSKGAVLDLIKQEPHTHTAHTHIHTLD